MLVLRQIAVENFGPFVGRQVVEIPDQGVTVVYGENGRGKSNLLNAIRYAFYGKVLGRGARERQLHSITNRERAALGEYGFQVVLSFDFDGVAYELTRGYQPKPGTSVPETDSDYEQTVILKVGKRITGPQERDQLIREALPYDISRFFLFDGELLQEYEELLIDESDHGPRISAAIERILGVPILKQARIHLTHLAEDADNELAKAAQKDARTKAWAATLQLQSEMRTAQRAEIERLDAELKEFEREKHEQDQFLESRQRYTSLLAERDSLDRALGDARDDETQSLMRLRTLMEGAWRMLVADAVTQALAAAEESASAALADVTFSLRATALNGSFCEVCARPITKDESVRLEATLPEANSDRSDSIAAVAEAVGRVARLGQISNGGSSEEIVETWKRIERARVDQVSSRDRIAEIDASVSGDLPEAIRKSQLSRDKLIAQIHDHRRGIGETNAKLAELDSAISDLNSRIQSTSGASSEVASATTRATKLRELASIFEAAVEQYKHELRERVEADASHFFLRMTTEPEDYAALQVNESYGLQIVHKDGGIEFARSAGQEHVVALALMAALQRNAPIGGPIVMDSPFGRLDEGHTSRIIGTLPEMASQAVLLVYRSEVDQDAMRNALGSHLLREYQLDRISSRHTNITEMRG